MAFYESSTFSIDRNLQLLNRLKKNKIKNFWGSFIKKGIRPNKTYFYVLQKFRLLTGKSVDYFIKFLLNF